MSVIDAYGIAAAFIVVATMVVWFQRIKAVRVPKVRFPYFSLMILGGILGVYAFVAGAGLFGKLPAGLAIVIGFVFPAFRLGSAQGEHKPAVNVGDPIIDFTAVDDSGNEFSLASLRGAPFLLKFFRGHW